MTAAAATGFLLERVDLPGGTAGWQGMLHRAGTSPVSVCFLTDGKRAGPPELLDGLAIALLPTAMRVGGCLHVRGPMTRGALRNLTEYAEAWANWRPTAFRPVTITADRVIDGLRPPGNGDALFAWSGGAAIDAHPRPPLRPIRAGGVRRPRRRAHRGTGAGRIGHGAEGRRGRRVRGASSRGHRGDGGAHRCPHSRRDRSGDRRAPHRRRGASRRQCRQHHRGPRPQLGPHRPATLSAARPCQTCFAAMRSPYGPTAGRHRRR